MNVSTENIKPLTMKMVKDTIAALKTDPQDKWGAPSFCPLRFKTLADANLFMECLKSQKPFPEEKWIYPFKMLGNLSVRNPEYENAPYEFNLV